MLFRVHVVVLLAVPESLGAAPLPAVLREQDWSDAVSYFFGINASDAGTAVAIAERAAAHATDRDGHYIGGVVAEIQVSLAHARQFDGYRDDLLQPLEMPGIFHVTGTTHFGIPNAFIKGALDAFATVRNDLAGNRLPPPSFEHPKPRELPPPKPSRIVCPGCGRWAEFDSRGLIYACWHGTPPSPDAAAAAQPKSAVGLFMQEHAHCLQMRGYLAFPIFNAGDERYDALGADYRD